MHGDSFNATDTWDAERGWFRFRARDVAGAAVASVVLVALRWIFGWVPLIPNQLLFDPATAILVPQMGVFWGLFGMLGAFLASLAGDWLCGVQDGVSYFRALGLLAWAGSTCVLWHAPPRGAAGPVMTTLRFLGVAFPGIAIAASWMGLGVEWMGHYHFDYVFGLRWIYDFVFLVVFGLPLFHVLVKRARWGMEVPTSGAYPLGRALLLLLTSLTAPLGGLFADGKLDFRPSFLGEHGGRHVAIIALLCLMAHLVLVLAPVTRFARRRSGPGRFYYRPQIGVPRR